MALRIIDTNQNATTKLAQLRAEGIETVIRYLTTNVRADKLVQAAEARAFAEHGMRLGLVFEVWGGANNFEHKDINDESGVRHATFSASWANVVGAPRDAVVYFAIDTDTSDDQISKLVIPYFIGARHGLGDRLRIGVYGCGAVCERLLTKGHVDVAWLAGAMGWNGSKAFKDSKRWALLQGLPKTIAGLDTDPNQLPAAFDAKTADVIANDDVLASCGFIPFSGSVTVSQPKPQNKIAPGEEGAEFPPRPSFPPLTSNDARAKIFGKFTYKAAPTKDNPEAITVDPAWRLRNIMFVPIPQMEKLGLGDDGQKGQYAGRPSGMWFHQRGAGQLKAMWQDWDDAGLLPLIKTFDGSYSPRFVRGSKDNLSNHAFGSAFDINYEWNQLGKTPALANDTGSVRRLVPIANRHGFYWGGHFSRLDGMHFEVAQLVMGGPDAASEVTAAVNHNTAWMQSSLAKLKYQVTVDGIAGPLTRAAVSAFQRDHQLVVDGVAGPRTIAAIESALKGT